MTDKHIGSLVVLEQSGLVGVLLEHDCARRALLAKKPLKTTLSRILWLARWSRSPGPQIRRPSEVDADVIDEYSAMLRDDR
jgi:hypothetical protein